MNKLWATSRRWLCTSHNSSFKYFAQFARKKKSFVEDSIAAQRNSHPDLNMVALELKDQETGELHKWPSFEGGGEKQSQESLSHVYFHRYGGFDDRRYEETLLSLRDNLQKSICWVGTPGIGKCKCSSLSLLLLWCPVISLTLLPSHGGKLHSLQAVGEPGITWVPECGVLSNPVCHCHIYIKIQPKTS